MTTLPDNRRITLALFQSVLHQGLPLEEQAESLTHALDPRDRAFVRRTAATALRRLGQIDRLLKLCLSRPLPSKLKDVRDILRLGTAQLLFLGIPAHAVVATSVEMVRQGPLAPYHGLVNAVLRRLSRDGTSLLASFDGERLNVPLRFWRSWTETYGEETTHRIAAAHLEEPPLDLTLFPGEDPILWADRLDAILLPSGSLRRSGSGPIASLPGFDEGKWWVQDAAAALPARLLGAHSALKVIDLCAAPGGKTMQLAAAGAQVVAVDRSSRRLNRVRENLSRLGLKAEIVTADARLWRPSTPADAVLIDAPCSATGTIRRHPDVPYHRTPQDIAGLVALQRELLDASAAMVKPGGLVVFCVCSLQREEAEAQIEMSLAKGLPFVRVPVTPEEIGGLRECLTAEGDLRTLPCHLEALGGMDGFFASRLRRL